MSKTKLVAGMAIVGIAWGLTSAPIDTTANESAIAPASTTLEEIVSRMAPAEGVEAIQPRREEFVSMIGDAMSVVMHQISRKDIPAAPIVVPAAPAVEAPASDGVAAE